MTVMIKNRTCPNGLDDRSDVTRFFSVLDLCSQTFAWTVEDLIRDAMVHLRLFVIS